MSSFPDFLAGGGDMGERMRGFDWSKTALGPVESWPQSLRSAVSILLPSKAQIVVFWGPEFTTLYNDAYRPTFGEKHPRVLGKPGSEAWSEIWEGGLSELFRNVVETGDAFWAEDRLFLLERNGYPEETYYDVSYDPIRDESGKVGGIFCIVSEKTGRVLGERRLRALHDLAERGAHAESVEEACTLAIESLSRLPEDIPFAWFSIAERDPAKPPLCLSTPGTHPHTDAYDAASILAAGPELSVVELGERAAEFPRSVWDRPVQKLALVPLPASRPSGRSGMLAVGLNPLRPLDTEYRGFLELVARQLAATIDRARAYEEEKQRAAELAELDRAKTAFFSNVSHEFRTPLTLMMGPLADVLDKPSHTSAEAREMLELVERNGRRLLKLVNTLLDFSRIEAGRVNASYRATDLAMLTADLTSGFRPAVEKAGLSLEVQCAALEEPVYVDREMWEKILFNLLSNALKFTFSGGIRVELALHGTRALLSVTDTGVGIPELELPHVFERFRRVEGMKSRTHEGTGIGLSLVQELTRLHGGEVTVTSREGQGSQFVVAIPRGKAHLSADRVQLEPVSAPAGPGAAPYLEEALGWLSGALPAPLETGAAPRRSGAARRRIVWADDNGDMRNYVERLLRRDYDVEACVDGRAALEAIRARKPDLVLSDVMMPNLDGFGLLEALRSDENTRSIPVILLSARANEEASSEGISAGADDYLCKPFSARELLSRIDARLERVRAEETIGESERRYRSIFETAAVAIWECDLSAVKARLGELRAGGVGDLRRYFAEQPESLRGALASMVVRDVNDASVRLFGARDKATLLASFARLWTPESERAYLEQLVAIDSGQRVFECETVFQTLAGERVDVLLAMALPPGDDATRTSALATLTDITERKRAERALQDEASALETLNRVGKAVVAELDLERVMQAVTDAATELSGAQFGAFFHNVTHQADESYTLFTLSGAPREAFERFGMPRNTAVFAPTFAGEGTVRLDDVTKDPRYGKSGPHYGMPKGHLPVRSYLAVPVVARSGEVVGGLFFGHSRPGVFTERAERLVAGIASQAVVAIENARLYQQRLQLIDKLREGDRRKDEFLATLSHELRNPLAPLRNSLYLLRMGENGNAQTARLREVMTRQVDHLVRLVDDLLEMSRISRGALELRRERVELATIVRNAVETSQPLIATAGHELVVKLPEAPIWLDGDPVRLAQILANLLNNAAKYTPESGQIELSAETVGENVEIRVRDNGIGMAAESIPRMFEMFARENHSTGRSQGGLGIGLALARRLAEMHGGTIEAESAGPGQGSEFRVRLPTQDAATAEHSSRPERRETRGLGPKRVLVVDDNVDAAESLGTLLSFLGADVRTAHSGPSALELFGSYEPAVVLLDIGMPGMDGYEVARRVRSAYPNRQPLLVALTGWGQEDDRRRALEAGFDHHLVKPADFDAIRALLASLGP